MEMDQAMLSAYCLDVTDIKKTARVTINVDNMSDDGFVGFGSLFDLPEEETDRNDSSAKNSVDKVETQGARNRFRDARQGTLNYRIRTKLGDKNHDGESKTERETVSEKLKALPTFSDVFRADALDIDEDVSSKSSESQDTSEAPSNSFLEELAMEAEKRMSETDPIDLKRRNHSQTRLKRDLDDLSDGFLSRSENDENNNNEDQKDNPDWDGKDFDDFDGSAYPSSLIDLLNQDPGIYDNEPSRNSQQGHPNLGTPRIIDHQRRSMEAEGIENERRELSDTWNRFERRQVLNRFDEELDRVNNERDRKLRDEYGFPESYHTAPERYHTNYLDRYNDPDLSGYRPNHNQGFDSRNSLIDSSIDVAIPDQGYQFERYTQYNENMRNDLHGHQSHVDAIEDDHDLCDTVIQEKGAILIEELQHIQDRAKHGVLKALLDGEWHNEKELIRIAKKERYIGSVSFGMMMLSFCEIVDKRFLMKKIVAETSEPQYKINDNFVGLARAAFDS